MLQDSAVSRLLVCSNLAGLAEEVVGSIRSRTGDANASVAAVASADEAKSIVSQSPNCRLLLLVEDAATAVEKGLTQGEEPAATLASWSERTAPFVDLLSRRRGLVVLKASDVEALRDRLSAWGLDCEAVPLPGRPRPPVAYRVLALLAARSDPKVPAAEAVLDAFVPSPGRPGDSPRQLFAALRKEEARRAEHLARLENSLEAARAQIAALRAQRDEERAKVRRLRGSWSFRMTRPLRTIRRWIAAR